MSRWVEQVGWEVDFLVIHFSHDFYYYYYDKALFHTIYHD